MVAVSASSMGWSENHHNTIRTLYGELVLLPMAVVTITWQTVLLPIMPLLPSFPPCIARIASLRLCQVWVTRAYSSGLEVLKQAASRFLCKS